MLKETTQSVRIEALVQSRRRKQIESRCKTAALQFILLASIALCHVAIPEVGNVRFPLGAWPELAFSAESSIQPKKVQLLGGGALAKSFEAPLENFQHLPVRSNWSLRQPRKTHSTEASYSSLRSLHGCWGAAGWPPQEQVSAPSQRTWNILSTQAAWMNE